MVDVAAVDFNSSINSTIERITRAKLDFGYFCRTYLKDPVHTDKPLDIRPYQVDWVKLSEAHKRLILFAPRGYGKTFSLSTCRTIWKCCFNPGHKVVITSPTARHSSKLLRDIRITMKDNPFLHQFIDWRNKQDYIVNATTMEWINKASVECVVYGENARGRHPDDLVLDEVSQFKEHETLKALTPMVERRGGRVIGISTPFDEKDLACDLTRRPEYFFKKYPAMNGDGSVLDETVIPKKRLLEMQLADPLAFAREYLCQPCSLSDGLFELNWLARASTIGKDLSFETVPKDDYDYYGGFDFATSSKSFGDFSAFISIAVHKETGIIKIVDIRHMKGVDIKEQTDIIRFLHGVYDYKNLILDASGASVGQSIYQDLQKEGYPVFGQTFEKKSRDCLIMNLVNIFNKNRIIIPRNGVAEEQLTDILVKELSKFITVKSDSGVIIYKSASLHDDCGVSLALACKFVGASYGIGADDFFFGTISNEESDLDEEIKNNRSKNVVTNEVTIDSDGTRRIKNRTKDFDEETTKETDIKRKNKLNPRLD